MDLELREGLTQKSSFSLFVNNNKNIEYYQPSDLEKLVAES